MERNNTQKNKKAKIWLITIGAILLSAALIVGGYFIYNYLTCEHVPGKPVGSKEATCENAGFESYECIKCGRTYSETVTTSCKAGEWSVESESTCMVKGVKVKKCVYCGKTMESANIPLTDCTSKAWVVISPSTCQKQGLKKEQCTVCNKVYDEMNIAVVDCRASDWSVKTNPTCTSNGLRVKTCVFCDKTIQQETIYTDGHKLGNWEITKTETCTINGEKVQKCSKCKEVINKEVIPAHHTPVTIAAVKETCSEYGYTEGSKCSVCEQTLTVPQRIDKLDHTVVVDAAKAATCKESGYTEGSHCKVCETVIVAQNTIPKLDHTVVKDSAVAATCTASGLKEGSHCSECKTVIVAQKSIPALGHNFSVYTNLCSRCPAKEYTEIRTNADFINYDGDYNCVIFLDYCMNSADAYYIPVRSSTEYIRMIGTPGVQYKIRFIADTRNTPLQIDLVNVTLATQENHPTIKSASNVNLTVGFYGEKCGIIGKTGDNGANATLTNANYNGKNGGNGNIAIECGGNLTVFVSANDTKIVGGNGGKGGKGMNAAPAPQDGGNGGNGGNGAYAIKASSITVKFANGYSKSDISLEGGTGGAGGAAGEGFAWGDDGKKGSAGSSSPATNVTVVYK